MPRFRTSLTSPLLRRKCTISISTSRLPFVSDALSASEMTPPEKRVRRKLISRRDVPLSGISNLLFGLKSLGQVIFVALSRPCRLHCPMKAMCLSANCGLGDSWDVFGDFSGFVNDSISRHDESSQQLKPVTWAYGGIRPSHFHYLPRHVAAIRSQPSKSHHYITLSCHAIFQMNPCAST